MTPGNIPGLVPGSPAAAAWLTARIATPLTPGNIPGLVSGSPAFAAWWTAQIAHTGLLAQHVKKRQAATPLTPGNLPGLVPESPAAAAWWTARIATPLSPGNIPGLVSGSPESAAYWTAQIAHTGPLAHYFKSESKPLLLTPGYMPGLVYPAAAAWWTGLNAYARRLTHQ